MLVKHIKNRTLLKHTFIYTFISKLVKFIGEVYKSGNVAVKTVLIVIGYPIVIALTFFMFPITIGIAAWFAFKKVKAFQQIQDGIEIIRREIFIIGLKLEEMANSQGFLRM